MKDDCVAIIEFITGLARRLNITTVAEGVETSEQLASVTEAGCNKVQGFYFNRPVPASDILNVLSDASMRGTQSAASR